MTRSEKYNQEAARNLACQAVAKRVLDLCNDSGECVLCGSRDAAVADMHDDCPVADLLRAKSRA